MVVATGFEPVTFSMSTRRSTAELSDRLLNGAEINDVLPALI